MTRKKVLALGILLVFALFTGIFPVNETIAAGTGQFGGEIASVSYCTCPLDLAVIVSIDQPGNRGRINLKYSLFYSRLHSRYSIFYPGPNVVGGYSKIPSECFIIYGTGCMLNKAAPTPISGLVDWVRGVGTSSR